MTTTAAYPATMTELRGEPSASSLWSNYGNSINVSHRVGNTMEPGLPNPASSPHLARPRSEHASMDHTQVHYGRYGQDGPESYEPHPQQTSLASQNSYSNLKRSFSQTETPAYQEIVQDLRDDGSRMNMNQDHKLLAFRKTPDKHTITDQHGRVQSLELSAQLHGMFFLSELPNGGAEGSTQQPELTCYRRNLFQISGSLVTPRGPLTVITESGESVPVTTTEVTVSAIESVDNNPVRLIVIPWKTPPPNSTEVSQTPDQEPPSLPLIPFHEDGSQAEGEFAVYPVGWRRLQFRIATANNGRRKELQQHFVLHLKLHGTLASGSKIVLTESTTAPIVVRGRSPRNFQARKEIPLLGSSAGSRGQALVESGLGVVAGPIPPKPQDAKTRAADAQVPRSAFTFTAGKVSGPSMNPMRSSTYPSWNQSGTMNQVPSTSPGQYPAATLSADPYSKGSLSGSSNFTTEPAEIPLAHSMTPLTLGIGSGDQQQPRSQYAYNQTTATPRQIPNHGHSLSGGEQGIGISRYGDSVRPSKSPRTAEHQTLHNIGSVANPEAHSDYRYGSYGSINAASDTQASGYGNEAPTAATGSSRDYYPSSNTWTTTAGEASASLTYSAGDGRSYAYQEPYKGGPPATQVKTEASSQAPSAGYNTAGRAPFVDALNNYSWASN